MDKYTVDLDKVLNDFEYSELTEQNSSYTADGNYYRPNYSYDNSLPYEAQAYHKVSSTNVKHSINTVFHSLNEYISKDIDTNVTEAAKPVFSNSIINNDQNSYSQFGQTDSSASSTSDTSPEKLYPDHSIESFLENSFKRTSQKEIVPTFCDSDYSVENYLDNVLYSKIEKYPNKNNTDVVVPVPDTSDNENSSNSSVIKSTNSVESAEEISESSKPVEIEEPVEEYIEFIPTSQTSENAYVEDIKEEKENEVIIDNNETDSTNDVELSENNIIDNVAVDAKTIITDTDSSSLLKQEPVGFGDDDISDSEIEQELKKLEQALVNGEEEVQKDLKTELEESAVTVINDTEEITPVINKETDVNDEESKSDVVEGIVQQEEPKIEKVINVVQISDKISVEITEKASESDRKNSLRPNSLEIDKEKTINLIGNPGSTPFNNVYVENSFQTKNEGEASNSLSPTLSDVSTSETSDSPNTSDSCNDTSLDEVTNSGSGSKNNTTEQIPETQSVENTANRSDASSWIGKTAPIWIPDSDTDNCQHCDLKFTVIKRRHHCRACGLVLCSKCCNMKYKLEFLDNAEARVCVKCYVILSKYNIPTTATSSGSDGSPDSHPASPVNNENRQLNPANPMEYCSVVPPHQQVSNLPTSPPSVMVPVGVLKRKGSGKSRSGKSVMFCDGIRPGCDLTELDYNFDYKEAISSSSRKPQMLKSNKNNVPKMDPVTSSYIPSEENALPPTATIMKSELSYSDCLSNDYNIVESLQTSTLTFALQRNLLVHVKIINMECCINKQAWCFTTEGMITAGQDEIVILLEFMDNEKTMPKDIFLHLNNIYNDAVKGTSITELGLSIHTSSKFLDSKNHAGFLYVRPSFQCIQNVIIPKEPYLIGILIHRWETPWAKIFPLRLLLRLGAEYRYYPCPIISTRQRESVYVEIGHTIINLLADFRNFSYTLPSVRGLTIHMEEKNTTVRIPSNRYDQVIKAVNNSSDYILAFAGNFSPEADSHLVCIQDTDGNNENSYTTHAINIHNKPRKVTGASFIVLNGALKSTSGLTAKSSIVEDGLMIQILPEQMVKLRNSLRDMKDFKINCGCVNAQSDESVNITWIENDLNFNVGVVSPIDSLTLSGIPSIRVHNGKDYMCNSGNKMIRWTEVFIIQSGDEPSRNQQDPVDISKLSESISKATSQALVKYLDLLATNSFYKIGIRTTLHVENVSYLAGSNGVKLPPIYMKSLDNELIPVLHKITTNNLGDSAVVLELVFHILNV